MTKEKCNDFWKILRNDQLEFDTSNNNDIICIICKRILVNAHSGPCGCRYCLECLTCYLNGEENVCPGNTDDCTEELININKNVFPDQPTNIKISKIIIKCPEKNCEFKDELRNIEDHRRICDFRSTVCPYLVMGCKESNIKSTDMKNHMLTEIVAHSKMMFELIDNLKNEIKMLKENKVKLEMHNKDLEKRIDNLQLKYENENKEIKEKVKEIETKIVKDQENVNELKREIKELKKEKESIKEDISTNQVLINYVQLYYESESKEIKEKVKNMENNFVEKQATTNANIDKITTNLKSISNESNEAILHLENEMRMLEKNQERQNYGEFVWCIEKWKEKMERAEAGINKCIISNVFYSHRNGYKMCLSVYPNGNGDGLLTHMSIYFSLMRGEFDDILPWPFKHDVTYELIDQHTSLSHTSQTISYNDDPKKYDTFKKPISDENTGYGNPEFILLKELSNNISLIENDRIFIKCRVTKSID